MPAVVGAGGLVILYLQPSGTRAVLIKDLTRMIDSSLRNYRGIPLTLHSHRRTEAPSAIKDTKSEA